MSNYGNFTNQQQSTGSGFVSVYNHEFTRVYEVPQCYLPHLPPPELQITRLVRCTHYKPYDRDSCRCGERCKFVHADCDYELLESHSVHVNYIWPSRERCIYPRLPSGGHLLVYAPNQRLPCEVIPSEMVLVTSGSINYMSGAPLSHCAHYYLRRQCDLGSDCKFIHAVYVDSTVRQLYKRAPPRFGQGTTTSASSAQQSLYVNTPNVIDEFNLTTTLNNNNNIYYNNYEFSQPCNVYNWMTGHNIMQYNNNISSPTVNVYTENNQVFNIMNIHNNVYSAEGNATIPFSTPEEPTIRSELSWPEPPYISETTLEIVNRASELSLPHDDDNNVCVESSTSLPNIGNDDGNAEASKNDESINEDHLLKYPNMYFHNPYDAKTSAS